MNNTNRREAALAWWIIDEEIRQIMSDIYGDILYFGKELTEEDIEMLYLKEHQPTSLFEQMAEVTKPDNVVTVAEGIMDMEKRIKTLERIIDSITNGYFLQSDRGFMNRELHKARIEAGIK